MHFTDWVDYTFGMGRGPSMLEFHNFPGQYEEIVINCAEFFRSGILPSVPRENIVRALRILPSIDGQLGVLAVPTIPFSDRLEIVHLWPDFFGKVFFDDDYCGSAFMWWEWLQGASLDNYPAVHNDSSLCHDILDACSRILEHKSDICQMSALHGLNEFAFDDIGEQKMKESIDTFLRYASASTQIRDYAWSVLRGQAQ